MRGGPSGVMAGCFGLTAFVVAIAAGLAAHNSAVTILGRAIIAMILCYPLGLVVGGLCHRVVRMHETSEFPAGESAEPVAATEAAPESEDVVEQTVEPAAGDREALAV